MRIRVLVMARKLFIILALISLATAIQAQEEKALKRVVTLSGGIANSEAWEIEPSITYFLCPYLGGTLGFTITKQYNSLVSGGTLMSNSNLRWSINDDYANIINILFRPAITLQTPIAWLNKDRDTGLSFKVEPGLYMALSQNDNLPIEYRDKSRGYALVDIKNVSNTNGNWLFWNVTSAVSLHVDQFILSAGYRVSNFDIYSTRRNIIIDNTRLNTKLPKRVLTHSVFLAIGYQF